MFHNAHAFNQPLAGWNTANLLWPQKMFKEARAFNQPLNTWTWKPKNTEEIANAQSLPKTYRNLADV
jgi:hypothetical protein